MLYYTSQAMYVTQILQIRAWTGTNLRKFVKHGMSGAAEPSVVI